MSKKTTAGPGLTESLDVKVEAAQPVEVVEEPEAAQESPTELSAETQQLIARTVITTGCNTLSGIMVAMTKIPEMAFSEEEVNSLVEVWTPFMPANMSPMVAAILATAIIISGKAAVYMRLKEGKEGKGEAAQQAA